MKRIRFYFFLAVIFGLALPAMVYAGVPLPPDPGNFLVAEAVVKVNDNTIRIRIMGDKVYFSGLNGTAKVIINDLAANHMEPDISVINGDAVSLKKGNYIIDIITTTQRSIFQIKIG